MSYAHTIAARHQAHVALNRAWELQNRGAANV